MGSQRIRSYQPCIDFLFATIVLWQPHPQGGHFTILCVNMCVKGVLYVGYYV